jgi:hypothetical protein
MFGFLRVLLGEKICAMQGSQHVWRNVGELAPGRDYDEQAQRCWICTRKRTIS